MNHKLRLSLIIVLCMAVTMATFGSNGTQIGTIGARSSSMGANFRGLADDWTAAFYNPAGLTQFDSKFTIGGMVSLIRPTGSYTALAYPELVSPFTVLDDKEHDLKEKNFLVPSFGLYYRMSEKVVLGLGVFAPFGLGTEWDIYSLPAGYPDPTQSTLTEKYEHYSDHQVINVQPTVAFQLSDKLSLGIGISYIWGKMDLDIVNILFLPAAVLGGFPGIVESSLSGSGSTFGATVGLLLKATEKLSIGVSARYAQDLAMTGDLTQKSLLYLQALNTNELEYDIEADLPLPMTAGIGFAYRASDKLVITADASYTKWDSWGDIDVKVKDGDDVALKQDWENTMEYGAGFEYKAMDKEDKALFIRGGFYTVDTPAPDETMSPTILDPTRRLVITGGLGLDMGKIALSIGGEYLIFKDNEIDEYNLGQQELQPGLTVNTPENYAGTYKFNAIVAYIEMVVKIN